MKNNMLTIFWYIIISLLAGCATTPSAKIQTGNYFQPNNKPPEKNMARVYIYRTHDQYSSISQVIIYANKKPITVLTDRTYQDIMLVAGNYQLQVSPLGYKTSITVKANKTYYVALSTKTRLNQQFNTPAFGYSEINAVPQIVTHYFGLVTEPQALDQLAFCKQITKITYPTQTTGQALSAPTNSARPHFSFGITVM